MLRCEKLNRVWKICTGLSYYLCENVNERRIPPDDQCFYTIIMNNYCICVSLQGAKGLEGKRHPLESVQQYRGETTFCLKCSRALNGA